MTAAAAKYRKQGWEISVARVQIASESFSIEKWST